MEVSIIWTASSWAAASASIIRLQTPARRKRTKRLIAPRCSRSKDPEDAIDEATVVHARNATRLVGQHRLDGVPFTIGELIAHDSTPPVGSLNHIRPGSKGNASGVLGKAEIGRRRVGEERPDIGSVAVVAHIWRAGDPLSHRDGRNCSSPCRGINRNPLFRPPSVLRCRPKLRRISRRTR